MTGLLICAAVVMFGGIRATFFGLGRFWFLSRERNDLLHGTLGLSLIAAALYLAWRAGGA